MTAPEEALRLYARGVVTDMCRALADHVDFVEDAADDEYEALAGGREFLAVTEVSVDPYLDQLVDVLTDFVTDVERLQNQRATPDVVSETREITHVRRARRLIERLGGQ